MTIDERAEKIKADLLSLIVDRLNDDPGADGVGLIHIQEALDLVDLPAEIRAAVEEGIRNYKPPTVRKETISEIVIAARKEAKAEAYEGAAKIADEVGVDSEEGREIARRIRARAREVGK